MVGPLPSPANPITHHPLRLPFFNLLLTRVSSFFQKNNLLKECLVKSVAPLPSNGEFKASPRLDSTWPAPHWHPTPFHSGWRWGVASRHGHLYRCVCARCVFLLPKLSCLGLVLLLCWVKTAQGFINWRQDKGARVFSCVCVCLCFKTN